MLPSIRVIRLYDSKTLSVSPEWKLSSIPGSPPISLQEMGHARTAFHTVFSIIQSDPIITPQSIHDLRVSGVHMGDLSVERKYIDKKDEFNYICFDKR